MCGVWLRGAPLGVVWHASPSFHTIDCIKQEVGVASEHSSSARLLTCDVIQASVVACVRASKGHAATLRVIGEAARHDIARTGHTIR